MVSLPTQYNVPINQGADKIQAGVNIIAHLLFDVDLPANASVAPGHGLGLKNSSKEKNPSSALRGLNLKGGVTPVAKVMNILVGAVPADAETVTVDGLALEFDATPTANQVDTSGGTAAAVATQLAQEINQQSSTVTAEVVSSVNVRVTAVTPGDDFTITDGTSGDLTITTVTANVVGVKSSLEVTLSGDIYANTISEIIIPVTKNSKTREIHIQYVHASASSSTVAKNSAAAGTALTLLKTTIDNIFDDVASSDTHRYFTDNVEDLDADVKTFMTDLFAAKTNFTISSNKLKIEAGETSVNGDKIKVYTNTLPSVMSPLPSVNDKLAPQFEDGVVVHAGIIDEPKKSTTIEELIIKGSNARGKLLSIQGDADDGFTIKLFINNDPSFLSKIIATGAVTYDSKRSVFTSNDNTVRPRIGLFLASKSKSVGSAIDARWYYDCTITGTVEEDLSLRGVGGYTLTVSINQDQERSGDPKFAQWKARAL